VYVFSVFIVEPPKVLGSTQEKASMPHMWGGTEWDSVPDFLCDRNRSSCWGSVGLCVILQQAGTMMCMKNENPFMQWF